MIDYDNRLACDFMLVYDTYLRSGGVDTKRFPKWWRVAVEDGAGGIRRRRVRPASREHYSKRFKRSNAPFVKFDSRRRTARSSARDEK